MLVRHRGSSYWELINLYPEYCTRATKTYRLEYMPGKRVLVAVSGSGLSHRSGFHSQASGPQISGLRFAAYIPMITFVLFGMRISFISRPSNPMMGVDKGRTVSFLVLLFADE